MKSDVPSGSESKNANLKIVDLSHYRQKKGVADELTRGGRKPLYVSHLSGQVTGMPPGKTHVTQNDSGQRADFGDRLQRIRYSLEKINRLMSDLKRMSLEQESEAGAPAPSMQPSKKP